MSRLDRLYCVVALNRSCLFHVHSYKPNTVTYGTKPAPVLASRILQQLALYEEKRFPLAAKAIVDDTYMDDVITGADEVETAKEMRRPE